MRDIQSQLQKLRARAAECANVRDRATDAEKRALFDKLAAHFEVLAQEVERTIGAAPTDTFLGRKTHEPFPMEDDA
jgi:hypothetical protein